MRAVSFARGQEEQACCRLLTLANFKIGGMAPFLRALFQLVALGAVSNVLCYDSRKSCHLLADWLLLNPN